MKAHGQESYEIEYCNLHFQGFVPNEGEHTCLS